MWRVIRNPKQGTNGSTNWKLIPHPPPKKKTQQNKQKHHLTNKPLTAVILDIYFKRYLFIAEVNPLETMNSS